MLVNNNVFCTYYLHLFCWILYFVPQDILCSIFCNDLFVIFQAVNCKGQHSISYTLSRNQTVVVEYSHDNDTDMFQVKPIKMTLWPVRIVCMVLLNNLHLIRAAARQSFIISRSTKGYIQNCLFYMTCFTILFKIVNVMNLMNVNIYNLILYIKWRNVSKPYSWEAVVRQMSCQWADYQSSSCLIL